MKKKNKKSEQVSLQAVLQVGPSWLASCLVKSSVKERCADHFEQTVFLLEEVSK